MSGCGPSAIANAERHQSRSRFSLCIHAPSTPCLFQPWSKRHCRKYPRMKDLCSPIPRSSVRHLFPSFPDGSLDPHQIIGGRNCLRDCRTCRMSRLIILCRNFGPTLRRRGSGGIDDLVLAVKRRRPFVFTPYSNRSSPNPARRFPGLIVHRAISVKCALVI